MTSKEALKRLKQETVPVTYNADAYTFKDECIEVIQNDLDVLEIIKHNPLLDLSLLREYDLSEYDEFYDDWEGTTNELSYDAFKALKEFFENN